MPGARVFAAASNPLFGKLKRMQRPVEPWLTSQLLAMETGSLRIVEALEILTGARPRDRPGG